MATPTVSKNQVKSMVEFLVKKPGQKRTFFVDCFREKGGDMRRFLISIMGALAVFSAYATGENVPTSRSYVDSALTPKQDIIERTTGANQVLTNTGTAGEYGTKEIYNSTNAYGTQQDALVDAQTMNAGVQNAIDSEFQCIEWANPNDHTSDCLLMEIRGKTQTQSPNLFDISKVPTHEASGARIVNNGDGTITVTSITNGAIITGKKLSELAPEMTANDTYTLSFETTGTVPRILLYCFGHTSDNTQWARNTSKMITENLLDCTVYFYASGTGTTATISDIQIERGSTATPYQPYGNVYVPAGN